MYALPPSGTTHSQTLERIIHSSWRDRIKPAGEISGRETANTNMLLSKTPRWQNSLYSPHKVQSRAQRRLCTALGPGALSGLVEITDSTVAEIVVECAPSDLGRSGHGKQWCCLEGVSNRRIFFRPCIQSGPKAATNDVPKARVSHCRTSRPWRLGVQVAAKGRRANASVAVVAALLAAKTAMDLQAGECSGTGICPIQHCCSDTTRILAGDGTTLVQCPRVQMEGEMDPSETPCQMAYFDHTNEVRAGRRSRHREAVRRGRPH